MFQERIVTTHDENRCENPIFLIGLHRSGTSLMRRVFNSHPEIACPPETFFLEHYARMLRDPMVLAGYRSFGHDAESMRRDLVAKASQLHEGFRKTHGKRRWADKTPQYVSILEELNAMFGPQAQFVMIYRNPLDVAHSVISRGWDLSGAGEEADPANQFEATLAHMARMYDKQMTFEAEHPELCVRAYYEEVVARPEEVMADIMAGLGEKFHPLMLRHHEVSHNFGTEDPMVRGLKGFQASHGNWTSWNSGQISRATEILGPFAKRLGYSLDKKLAAKGGRL
ncbi:MULTISPECIES: sulfotransferase [unclassified Thioclava]|uniref:sulfotransferase family protein n=1 Tax=unclassified Thioclava TaxID=2621713 RepID=UPI0009C4C357|nr:MULTISPECIES: sulfotransferase [unclassified Thioclava]OOY06988.1 hypothetical protein BMI89_19955 [Thioclava sp. F36-7]OOY15010.1 hypothetical protein BMI85_15775 [Thioclava sp. DLFJ4-1]